MVKMSVQVVFFFIFSWVGFRAMGQMRDTSLLTLYSKPFYYNLVKDWKGNVLAGTSDGIYQMVGSKAVKIAPQTGYLKINEKGKAVTDSNGIKYHEQSSMLHLLPFPSEIRDEFHAGSDNFFYITSGGRMHVYEIKPFAYRFRNHSIRTISSNFTGTYSGIYYKQRHLGPPVSNFSDGYIREYNGKVFMCSHGLDVFELKDVASRNPFFNVALPKGYNFVPARDINYSRATKSYILATGNRLAIMDSSLQFVQEIFKGNDADEIVLLGEMSKYNLFYFANGDKLYVLNLTTKEIRPVTRVPGSILDGTVKPRTLYLLVSNGLYADLGKSQFQKLVELRKAHTIREIAENEFVIATDEGLFLFKQSQNKLQTLIPGVEFNRRALFVENKKLYAGSINGLYIIDLSQIDNIIASNAINISAKKAGMPAWLIIASSGIILILLVVLGFYRRNIQKMQAELNESVKSNKRPKLSRTDIEKFIQESLPTASLKAIVSHFGTNNSMVYSLLAPDKPGDLIQQLRYEKVKELRREGKTAKEIAAVTGLSDSYVRKIWNSIV